MGPQSDASGIIDRISDQTLTLHIAVHCRVVQVLRKPQDAEVLSPYLVQANMTP